MTWNGPIDCTRRRPSPLVDEEKDDQIYLETKHSETALLNGCSSETLMSANNLFNMLHASSVSMRLMLANEGVSIPNA